MNLEQLARETAEDLFFKSMLIEGDILLPLEHKINQAAIKRAALIILSALNKAVKEKNVVITFLRRSLDFNKCYEQPCNCEDCVDITNDLKSAENMLKE